MSTADECKALGNKAFIAKDYEEAIKHYTAGIKLDPNNHVLYSNLSAAYIGMSEFSQAIPHCKQAIKVNPSWIKGYYRAAMAYEGLKLFQEGISILKQGLKAVPNHADLKRKLNELETAKRNFNPIRDANNQPLHPALQAKQLGNKYFKESLFDKAIAEYSRGIQILEVKGEVESDMMMTLRNNRAACYLQHHAHRKVVADCSFVLEREPENVKSLMRRGLAYEALEKWKLALADLSKARELEPSAQQAAAAVTRVKNILHRYT